MKKLTTFFATILFLISIGLNAQTQFSVLTGINVSTTSNTLISSDLLHVDPVAAWNIALIMDRNLDQHLLFRTGMKYVQKGFEISESTSVNVFGIPLPLGLTISNRINYLEVPLHLAYSTGNNGIQAYFAAGPSIAYATSASVKTRATAILDFALTDSALSLDSNDYNRWNILLNGQAGIKIPYGKGNFVAEIGYSHGLNSFTSDNFIIDTGLKHRDWSFNFGYGMRF